MTDSERFKHAIVVKLTKITLLGLVFCTSITTIASTIQSEISRSAKWAQTKIDSYNLILDTIHDISNLETSNESESVERDLIICELAGESSGSMKELYLALSELRGFLDDEKIRFVLDRNATDLLNTNTQFRYGFCRGSSRNYRNIKSLQNDIIISKEILQPIEKIVEDLLKIEEQLNSLSAQFSALNFGFP